MTRTGVPVVATALLLLAANAGAASGDVRRERTERRPYIVEIDQPYVIGAQRLQQEVNHISALKTYVRDYGYPDYTEIQDILPEWPWATYEVRLYYMRRNLEVDFGPVILSEATPNFGVLKFRGDITPEKRHEIEVVLQAREAPPAPPVAAAVEPVAAAAEPVPPPAPPSEGGLTEALVARIEAAAERAAQAADRAAQDSEAAARAAERTVNIVDNMEREGAARE
jgi:hypothetical protein